MSHWQVSLELCKPQNKGLKKKKVVSRHPLLAGLSKNIPAPHKLCSDFITKRTSPPAEGDRRQHAWEMHTSTWGSSISVRFAFETSMACASSARFDEQIFFIALPHSGTVTYTETRGVECGWEDWGGDRCPQDLQVSCSGTTQLFVFQGVRFNNNTCDMGKIQSSSLSVWKYTKRHHSRLHIITSFKPPHDSPHLVLIKPS